MPIRAVLRRKTNEAWTDKHRNVTRKLVVEGGRVQKRLYDIGWSDEKMCRGCNKEEGTEKHRLFHCPCWKEVGKPILGHMGTKGQDLKERLEVAERNHVTPSERRSLEEKPSDSAKEGIGKTQVLGHSSRRFPEACCH